MTRLFLLLSAVCLSTLPGRAAEVDSAEGPRYERQIALARAIELVPSSPRIQLVIESSPLPADAKEAVDAFDRQAAEIQRRADAEIATHRTTLIDRLQAMQDAHTRAARLDEAVAVRDRIRRLRQQGSKSHIADPGNLSSYRSQNGNVLYIEVVGDQSGYIWGHGHYTDDSNLATAVVHAGVLAHGQRGVVKVTISEGRDSYIGSTVNGVTSHSYSAFPGSYTVEAAPGATASAKPQAVRAAPSNMAGYRANVGESFVFQVTGSTSGSVYGVDVYTDDSDVATAAVHAGVLSAGQVGLVRVTVLPGQASYSAAQRNGISSYSYSQWGGSYRVEAAGLPATLRTQ